MPRLMSRRRTDLERAMRRMKRRFHQQTPWYQLPNLTIQPFLMLVEMFRLRGLIQISSLELFRIIFY